MRKWRSICSSRTRMINGQGCSNNNKSIAVIYFVLPQQHLEILSSSVRAGWVIWYPRRKGENGRTESPRKGIWPSFLHKLHGIRMDEQAARRWWRRDENSSDPISSPYPVRLLVNFYSIYRFARRGKERGYGNRMDRKNRWWLNSFSTI